MGKKSEDPVTIWATRIKKKNKKMLKELIAALALFVCLGLFFTTCWGMEKYMEHKGWKKPRTELFQKKKK